MADPNMIINDLVSMPNPQEKGLLHFKGKRIDAFLSKYEYYADHAHLTKVGRCMTLRLYFSKKEKEVLDILEGYHYHNWSQLKRELQSLYSSSSDSDISLHTEKSKLKHNRVSDSDIRDPRSDSSSSSKSKSLAVPEFASSSLCNMCRESYHDIRDCLESRFLIFLGICVLDASGQVVMSNGSVLPPAEGEGGAARIIREREADRTTTPAHTSKSSPACSEIEGPTPDLELVALSAMESDSLPSEHGMEHEALISESHVYADSFDYGEMSPMCVYEEPGSYTVPSQYMCSSTYDYTNDIDNFMSKKGDAYKCCDRDQPREELRPSYSSSEPESIHLDSDAECSQDSELESRGSVHGNPPFGSKSHVAPDFEPSSDLCTSYRVISNSSALSQLEEKRGVAQVYEAHCTATPVLNDSVTHPLSIDITSHDLEYGAVEALVDWNLKESSTLSEFTKTPSASPYLEESAPTLVMSTVPFRPSYESTSLSPPSSLVPETSHSSYGMPDHSPTKESSAMRHLEAKELWYSLVSLKYESPIESELESLTAQSIPRISRIQSNYSSPMSALGSSFESDHLFHAGNRPQCPSVHSARTKNMEIIRASLRRSNLNFDEGVERCALDDVYVHTEEADPSITQVSSRVLCDTSIQHVRKRDLGHLIRIFEWKPVPAYSYDFSVMDSILWTSRIGHPTHSMVLDSGFDLNDETILQAPERAQRN